MVYIRADGNSNIGMGHLMRTLSIASKCKGKLRYLVSDEASKNVINKRGFEAIVLGEAPFSINEAYKINNIINNHDVILLDSYLYDNDYVLELKKKSYVVCMDDLIENVFNADMIINYNTYASTDEYTALYKKETKMPQFITGGTYVPLRDEFLVHGNAINRQVKDILITTGGGDINNYAGRIAGELLKTAKLENEIRIHIVSGEFNPHYEELISLSEKNKNIIVHKNVTNMQMLMDKCDIAVSASGSTCYELCSQGLPFVVFAYADNQKRILKDMPDKGTALLAGMINSDTDAQKVIREISLKVKMLIEDYELRNRMHLSGLKLIDGDGANRLADIIEGIKEG